MTENREYMRGYLDGAREAWAAAVETAERQTNLADLVHFDKPSDFRKGVLTVITALREGAPQ